MSSDAPRATAAGGISSDASSVFRVWRFSSRPVANLAAPLVVARLQRMYSRRCHPVNSGSFGPAKSSTRASTAPSISSMSPAIGSIRSQPSRLSA